ncbi:DUF2892 domain-containing protein [Lysinibacillus sp. NPDC097195]|uniref:YgaP family membrane protein n=1 Tax=Lysinibacillus sp. NPDC097195 TaxID=3364141 RepID=UPI00380260C8
MTQQANLSDKNAFCRFALGTGMTAFGIARASRNPNCMKGGLLIALGAMKMAEGIFKYCPLKAMKGSGLENVMNTSMQSMFSEQNSMSSGQNSMSSGQNPLNSEQNPMSTDQINKLMQDFSSAITGNASEITTSTAKTTATDANTSTQNSSDSKNSTTKAQNPS